MVQMHVVYVVYGRRLLLLPLNKFIVPHASYALCSGSFKGGLVQVRVKIRVLSGRGRAAYAFIMEQDGKTMERKKVSLSLSLCMYVVSLYFSVVVSSSNNNNKVNDDYLQRGGTLLGCVRLLESHS